jgi:lipoprotein NlpI
MKKLIEGDRQTAADDFRKCVATDRKDFVEYRLARSELKALGE